MHKQANNVVEYIGFWLRVGASLIDSFMLLLIISPLMYLVYGEQHLDAGKQLLGGWDLILNYLFPIVAVLAFWILKSATPGKIVIHAIIVDATTGQKPSTMQFIVRYFGYIIATLPLGLGILWVAWDDKKQGWHDKLANTVVIRVTSQNIDVAHLDA